MTTTADKAGRDFISTLSSVLAGANADIQKASDQLTAAFSSAGLGTWADDIITAAHREIGQQTEAANLRGATAGWRDSTIIRQRPSRIRRIAVMVERALLYRDDKELRSAEETLQATLDAAAAATAALASAVADGDADAVIKLRVDVEVAHPKRIADAELALAELRIAHAERELQPVKDHLARAQNTRRAALDHRAACFAALEAAQADESIAIEAQDEAERNVAAANTRLNAAKQNYAQLVDGHRDATARRQDHISAAIAQPPTPELEHRRYLP